jgi:hypothetical protein
VTGSAATSIAIAAIGTKLISLLDEAKEGCLKRRPFSRQINAKTIKSDKFNLNYCGKEKDPLRLPFVPFAFK